jgi:hypothetical protein
VSIEQAVTITAKLYETRKCVQGIYGVEWRERLQPYMEELKRIHKGSGIPYLTLGQQLAREMQTQFINPLMMLAAMVEILEPAEVKP